MKRKNSILFTFIVVMTALFAESAIARIQKDARECVKPRFSKFTPANLEEVAPGSTVSFVTNYTTGKASIKVVAKGIEIKDLRITDKRSYYHVEFDLPKSLENTFARIHIKARAKIGSNTCKHKDGWLIKIAGSQSGQANVEAVAEPTSEVTPAQPVDKTQTQTPSAGEAPSKIDTGAASE